MFRFSIRDVLWLTVVVALGVGWWLDRSELADLSADHRHLKTELETARSTHAAWLYALQEKHKADSSIETANEKFLRDVPGNADYQSPPFYLPYYGPLEQRPSPPSDGS